MASRSRRQDFVYSPGDGWVCPTCGLGTSACECKQPGPAVVIDDETARSAQVFVRRETKGRKGAGVTLVTGLPIAGERLTELARELKRLCASGGTIRNGVIEVQGDHRDRIVDHLAALGWRAKRGGG